MRKPRTLTWRSSRPEVLQLAVAAPAPEVAGAVQQVAPGCRERVGTKRSAVSSGRCVVARARRRAPPMQISPARRSGAGSPASSSTCTRVLAIGRPIDDAALPRPRSRAQVDQTVVSVGPYMFHSSPARAEQRLGQRPRGSASPPHSALNAAPPRQPASSSMRQVAGVACMTVDAGASRAGLAARAPSLASVARGEHDLRRPRPAAAAARAPRCRRTAWSPRPGASSAASPGARASRARKFDHRAMRHAHALGLAGRARGVDQVGERLAVDRGRGAGHGAGDHRRRGQRVRRSRSHAPAPARTARRRARRDSTRRAPESSSMKRRRSAGNAGSSGR